MNKSKGGSHAGAAITLMVLAPLIAEVLSGATRFSSLFVFPIEVCVWGGGALLIREAVRKRKLGWVHMLLLALTLSLAEELLIQQSSLAPMVIRLKGVTYARALGVNYVYLLWALIYEPVFVVFLPVYLTEMLFPSGKDGGWLSRKGTWLVGVLFLLGAYLAWYSWTRIARPEVFHVPGYRPSVILLVVGAVLIAALVFVALRSGNRWGAAPRPLPAPAPGILAVAAVLWAVLLEGLVVLAFGLDPAFPPLAAVACGPGAGAGAARVGAPVGGSSQLGRKTSFLFAFRDPPGPDGGRIRGFYRQPCNRPLFQDHHQFSRSDAARRLFPQEKKAVLRSTFFVTGRAFSR